MCVAGIVGTGNIAGIVGTGSTAGIVKAGSIAGMVGTGSIAGIVGTGSIAGMVGLQFRADTTIISRLKLLQRMWLISETTEAKDQPPNSASRDGVTPGDRTPTPDTAMTI